MYMQAVMALVKLLLATVISTRFSHSGSKQFISANLLSEPLYQSTPVLKRGVWNYKIFQKGDFHEKCQLQNVST